MEGKGFTMEDINISPISVNVNYSVSAVPVEKEDDPGIPEVKEESGQNACRLSENPGKTWRQVSGYAIIKLSEPSRRTQAWGIFKKQTGTR